MKIFSRFPVLRFVVPFSAGILLNIFQITSLSAAIAMLVLGFCVSIIFTTRNYATGKYAQRWLAGIPFYCCFIGLGSTLTWFHQSMHYPGHFPVLKHATLFVGEITDEPVRTMKGYRFTVSVHAFKYNCEWTACRGKLMVFLHDTFPVEKLKLNSSLVFSAQPVKIKGSSNPDSFEPGKFYAGKGTWHQVFIEPDHYSILDTSTRKTLFSYAAELRNQMLVKLKNHVSEKELGVAGALLLGYEEWLDPDLEDSWSGAGVLHVLCVSGMHVMLIYVILAALSGWMEKNSLLRSLRFLLLLGFIWFYAMVTGFSPSVVRAAAMISFVITGNWLNREASITNLLCSSCILMFCMNPYLIISPGFQLSFLAVCGIIFIHKLIFPLWVAPNRPLHLIWEMISVSLAAQITTFPLSLYLFHQFPNYFLIANLVIIPLSTIVMYSGLLLLVTDWIPFAGNIIGTATSYGIRALNYIVNFIGQLPGATSENVYLNFFETCCLYLLIILVPVWLVFKSRWLLFALLIALLIFSGERLVLVCMVREQSEVTVYHSRGNTIISVIKGTRARVITDLNTPQKQLAYATSEHLVNCLLRKVEYFNPAGEVVDVTELDPGKKIIFIKNWKKGHVPELSVKPGDYRLLILGGDIQAASEQIIETIHPSLVIFDHSCKKSRIKSLTKEFLKHGIPVHAVMEAGAYQSGKNSQINR